MSDSHTPSPIRWAQRINAPWVAALRHPWVESIVRLSAVEDTLRALHPMLSLTTVRARVLRIVDETATTKTFVLQPNALWAGAQAGQFVQVRLEIDGRSVERAYSLTSRPGSRRIAITVKRQDRGLVSGHLHGAVKVGDVLDISQALGEFTLPAEMTTVLPPKLLLLSAGSGITPVMAMLRELRARHYAGNMLFVHVCRTPQDVVFAKELQALATDWKALRLVLHFSAEQGTFSPRVLEQQVGDLSQRSTWMCGPQAFMDAVSAHWQAQGLTAPLHSERFGGAVLRPTSSPGAPVQVFFSHSGDRFTAQGSAPLLVQAERAGLAPKHGCRIGICRSCQCVKTSGTVQNLQTGELSSAPNELIRLCISSAQSDLELAL